MCWPVFLGSTLDLSPGSCNIDSENYDETKDSLLDLYGFYKGKNGSEKKNFKKDTQFIAWPRTNTFLTDER